MKQNKSIRDKIWDKTGLSWWCDWLQLDWKHYNWINLSLIHFYIEFDKYADEFVVELALLGFNLRWQLNLDKWIKTSQNEELKKRIKEVNKKWSKK